MSTRGLYTFIGEMFPAWKDHDGKRHPAKRAHSWNVYKHSDNYPTGAAGQIEAALAHAWQLPRYEADEFAAAFIAANKSHYINRELEELRAIYDGLSQGKETGDIVDHIKNVARQREYGKYNGGQVRLMPQGKPLAVAEKNCSDIEYRYEISCPKSDIMGAPRSTRGAELIVKCFEVHIAWRPEDSKTNKEELLFCGELPAFKAWAEAKERRAQAAYEKAEAKRKAKG